MVWQPGELAEELRAGAWEVLPPDAKTVFDTNPGELWKGLHGPPGTKRAAYADERALRADNVYRARWPTLAD